MRKWHISRPFAVAMLCNSLSEKKKKKNLQPQKKLNLSDGTFTQFHNRDELLQLLCQKHLSCVTIAQLFPV